MWQQFLAEQRCRARSGQTPSILYFPTFRRKDWTVEQKLEEITRWAAKLSGPGWLANMMQLVIDGLARDRLMRRAPSSSHVDVLPKPLSINSTIFWHREFDKLVKRTIIVRVYAICHRLRNHSLGRRAIMNRRAGDELAGLTLCRSPFNSRVARR